MQAKRHADEAYNSRNRDILLRAIASCRRCIEWLEKPHLIRMWQTSSLRPFAQQVRHFETIVIILSGRLDHLDGEEEIKRLSTSEEFIDPSDDTGPAVIPVQQIAVDVSALEASTDRTLALERVQLKLEHVGELVGIVGRTVVRSGDIIDRITQNVDDTETQVRAAQSAIVRRYYPYGYVNAPCGGLVDRQCMVRVAATWMCLCILFVLFFL